MSGARKCLADYSAAQQQEIMAQLHPQQVVPSAEKARVQTFVIAIEPMGKPRMTQQDKWKKRPRVVRYRAYADQLRAACPDRMAAPLRVSWIAYLPIPKSWGKKLAASMMGRPHRNKPDRDNIDKGILDALFEYDEMIASGELAKFWDDGKGPRIELTLSA